MSKTREQFVCVRCGGDVGLVGGWIQDDWGEPPFELIQLSCECTVTDLEPPEMPEFWKLKGHPEVP